MPRCFKTAGLDSHLPTPEELRNEMPMTAAQGAFIERSRETVEAILKGWDPRRLLIVGPCSIHDLLSAREYARRLECLSKRVGNQFFIIMRTYFEKPRTIIGWKGLFYDPDIDESYNLEKGMRQSRQLLLELADRHIPAGCELLEINTIHYYSDLVTWGCVGARTTTSPPHRQLAASLNFPIGFKNSIDGNADHAIHALIAAASAQSYLGISFEGRLTRIQAEGNPLCHVVLRGGLLGPNYYPESVQALVKKCTKAHVCNKILIDASHGNCEKKHYNQIPVFESIIRQIAKHQSPIAGVMLESHLEEGAQEISSNLRYGVSITDPCLDWETTEALILSAYDELHSNFGIDSPMQMSSAHK